MRILVYCILPLFLMTSLSRAQEVKVCDGAEEWPPYIYYERVNGKINKNKIIGAVKELFDAAFKLTDLTYSIELLPWKRCLKHVENFDLIHKHEIISNGSYSLERAKKYWPSIPLYITHRGVFYSEAKYPQGPPIQKKSDIANYKICGVLGYNYTEVLTWAKNIRIDQAAPSNKEALLKIAKGRCDIMITSIEPVYGAAAAGIFKIPNEIKVFLMPELKVSTFHFWVSKKSPRATELLTTINTAIMDIIYTQEYKKIFTKYLPNTPHLYE